MTAFCGCSLEPITCSRASISEHTGIVMACNYSADGNNILSNDEKVINVWNVKKQVTSLSIPIDQIPVPGSLCHVFAFQRLCPRNTIP